MYDKILVPMALDHGISHQTLKAARALLSDGGQILVLHVFEVPKGALTPYLEESVLQDGIAAARKIMDEKTAHIGEVTTEIRRGHAYRNIIDYAEEQGVDCIVIGSHKPNYSDYFIGSTAARVVRHAPCAVHVHRDS